MDILKKRGLVISTDGQARRALDKNNYYNVINGYKDLFLDTSATASCNSFKPGTNLRKLMPYLKSDIAQQVGKHEAISYYMTQYGYVPLWVLVNILSLGRISRFYSLMKQTERQAVAKKHLVSDKDLVTVLKMLTHYRNKCTHDERIYIFRIHRVELMNTSFHQKLGIPVSGSKPTQGRNDLFALMIILKLLLERQGFDTLISELRDVIAELRSELAVITIDAVLVEMGFPQNWEYIGDL